MMSLARLRSAGNAAGYYAKDNYYSAESAEQTSAWMGKGSDELQLAGPVGSDDFKSVLQGTLPDGSTIDARRGERKPGWDLTFSASKSVSLAALVGKDERLVTALRQSVAATIDWAERNIAEGRVWKGKEQIGERTGNLVVATFVHDINRDGEPQLHVHAVVVNATKTSDGKWHAIQSKEIYDRQHVLGTVFNAELRSRVEQLGYATVAAKNPIDGAFEIAGISRKAVEAFSTRAAEIRQACAERGRFDPSARERELAALSTRRGKGDPQNSQDRVEGWRVLAAKVGLDPEGLVNNALARASEGKTVWSQALEGLRTIGQRGLAMAARMGLTPKDRDELVPERLGRLEPQAFAAAQAVTSAARSLGESEAAFDRLNLIKAALECRGPFTVADVEARIALLEQKGLLLSDGDRLLTTEGHVRQETAYLAHLEEGRGRGSVLVPKDEASARVQEAATDLGLRRLNQGQQSAAVAILCAPDRVVLIQGGAGRGKSAALAPVVAIAREQGRGVIGLAVANKMARELGQATGAASKTVQSFLNKYERVIDGRASGAAIAAAKAELKGTFILVDEASQLGTYQADRLVRLANLLDVGRLALVGDTRQLGAVAYGKPFELGQKAGHGAAELSENLRARSSQMKAINAALDDDRVGLAFASLKPNTVEVARGEQAVTAARIWAALPQDQREETLLLASGRTLRAEANAAAQAELKRSGELTGRGISFEVLDRVTVTREGARQMRAYEAGRVVEFRTDLPSQRFKRGDIGQVIGIEKDHVRLKLQSGEERTFQPDKLPQRLRNDSVSVYTPKEIRLHAGDRLRWTANDHGRSLANSDMAKVEAVSSGKLTVTSLADGQVHELKAGDPMLRKMDLAYALNVHVAQGVTAKAGIMVMDSRERMLNTGKTFLVAVTRIAEKATLVIDDGAKLEQSVKHRSGEKTSAIETQAAGKQMSQAEVRSVRVPGVADTHNIFPTKGLELGL